MEKKFEIEGPIEQDPQEQDCNCSCTGVYIALVVFIVLFLTTASLFVYYQFYVGKINGDYKFDWSMNKKNTDYAMLKQLSDSNNSLKTKLDNCSASLTASANLSALFPNTPGNEMYYVQLGAFRTYDFTKYEPNLVNMFVESTGGLNKLIIGGFQKFTDACELKKDLNGAGFKGIFIVKKVDGKRILFTESCP